MSHRAGDGEAVDEGLSLVMSGVLPAKALEKKKIELNFRNDDDKDERNKTII